MALYIKKRDPNSPDYVDKKTFTDAMIEYARVAQPIRKACKEAGIKNPDLPPITPYIAECIKKIAEGLARKPNFSGYSYRDEMVSHAIENCVKVVGSFDPFATTRSGKPNAFGYFTQICYFAFLRVMKLEKTQEHIKLSILDQADLSDFAEVGDHNTANGSAALENVKRRLDTFNRKADKPKLKTIDDEEHEAENLEEFMK